MKIKILKRKKKQEAVQDLPAKYETIETHTDAFLILHISAIGTVFTAEPD